MNFVINSQRWTEDFRQEDVITAPLLGVLITMVDPRMNLTQQVADEVRNHFPDKVYTTSIPRNVRLSAAPSLVSRPSSSRTSALATPATPWIASATWRAQLLQFMPWMANSETGNSPVTGSAEESAACVCIVESFHGVVRSQIRVDPCRGFSLS